MVATLANALAERGVRVELLQLSSHDPRAQQLALAPSLSLYPLGTGRRGQQRRRLRQYLAERSPRALLSAGHRANLLAASQCASQAPWPTRRLSPCAPRGAIGDQRVGATRIVLSVHNAISPGLARLNPVRRWIRRRMLQHRYPMADRILCVSAGVATDLAELAPATRSKIRTQYNPIQGQDAPGSHPLHPWLATAGPPVILGVGRLTPQKGFDTLIRALAQLRYQPRPRLLILGEGPERAALERLAQQLGVAGQVALAGFVPNPRAHMAAAAAFVLSSAWEGFGNVLVEAMSTGTPVVATDCPSGPSEILLGGALGPLVPVGEGGRLAEAIDHTLSRPTAPERLRARAADFAPERIAAQYLQHLLPEQSA